MKILPSKTDQAFMVYALRIQLRPESEKDPGSLRVHRCGPQEVAVDVRIGRTLFHARMDADKARAVAQALLDCANTEG